MTYYDNQESVANIYVGLVERGWKCYGYKADESDSMTDYWSPARWDGIAEKNGFVLLVDVYSTSQSGYKKTKQGYTPDYDKISKLKATINDKAASPNEKEASQKIIDSMYSKQKESTIIVSEYPTFSHANPKGCNWHIEKDGNIIAKGKGAFQCDGYLFGGYEVETMKKVNAFIDKIESKIAGTEQLEAVQEKVVKKVIKPVEVTDRKTVQVGDILTFEYHGHFWYVNAVSEKTFSYECLGSEKRGYQRTKNGKRYYDYMTKFNTNIENGKIKIYELKEVEEVTYKTVYKKVNRKGQESNLLNGETVEVTEEPKQTKVNNSTKETKQIKIENDTNITVEVVINEEKKGIELYFTGKPNEGTRKLLKENGYRWHGTKFCWYTRKNDKTMLFTEAFVSAFNDVITEDNNEPIENEVPEVVEAITETENTITASENDNHEEITNITENPYNSEVVETVNGYYCHMKAWNMEPEEIEARLNAYNIPYSLGYDKFFFQGITEQQYNLVKEINKQNEAILFDDSFESEHITANEPDNNITEEHNSNHEKEPKGIVIDFSERFKRKQQENEINQMKDHFINNVLPFINENELFDLQKAYNSNDKDKLDVIWQKLMLSTAVRRAAEETINQM